ncbi:hypothetical protein [Paenibacillus sp. FSL L8-0638]|uniref:hypothetical protein n=1 Tax=Paenibacillus sp. FSL L8-0638 TaxID=2921604 RepID=UPI003158D524
MNYQVSTICSQGMCNHLSQAIFPFFLGALALILRLHQFSNKKVISDTFKQYIKRVCAIEFGGIPRLTEQAIYANGFAVISFTLNRLYTEVYTDLGYNFNITNSTAFDQFYVPGGTTSQMIDEVIDKISSGRVKKSILS